MEAVNGVSEGDKGGPPPPSPLTGCYLLIVIGEPHCNEHKDIILQRVAKGLLSWDVNDCLVDLEKELAIITEQALEGEEARYGERLIQFASENLVTEILIHPVVSTLAQCVRNLLSSFTRHRHIIHAGYTFANNGSWVLQDGTFSSTDFSEAFQEIEVLRVIRAYENGISIDLHCAPEGDWTRLPKEPFTKGCKVRVNPNDVLTAGSPSISSFINYLEPFLVPAELENILESSDVVGNIRFSRPTLYVFPGGQGDAALFGINGFNMLLDGGFSRKACFWDFVRHLDRLDAVLLTRLNNSNVNGISAVLKRKRQNALYPQIGHFFCNIQERKAILSPDGDKDKDPLLINLLDEGQEIVSNLRHLSLIPQVCYRDSEPINLYHKVGHGTLDMYVLSPAKDSKEVREFLQKWNNNDQKLFANPRTNKEFVFPLQNLVSICALLVWQPANPEDTITRILFPGSSPQNKIFEGLEKIKSLEFIKHPVCSEKSLAPTTIIKTKQSVIERIIQPEKKMSLDNKRPLKPTAEIIDTDMKNGEVNGVQPAEKGAPVKKSDSTESEKSISKPKKIIENGEKAEKPKPKPKTEPKPKARSESQQRKVKSVDKKPSPTTPKKQVEKINDEQPKFKPKPSPTSTPAKSAKEANNRKVLESKIKAAPKREPPKPVTEKKEVKTERKPISRRPKDISKLSGSPAKKVNGVQKPDSISRRGKLDKEGTTDSSTVSTPSAEQDSILKKDISKLTSDEIQNLKAIELADLKEEQEAVKEIEAVFRKGELQEDKPSDFRKIKDISIDDKLENEEYLIIEKTEIEQDLVNESNKEEETQKIARDSEESEKQRKLSEEKETGIKEQRKDIQDEVQEIITSAADIAKAKDEVVEASKEASMISPEDKIDVSTDKKDIEEIKETAQESQPDEKGSANIESGATTTAPTLPEDERMPLDEIKEDNGDQIIEEKHVKEDTKEKDVPVIQLPPKTFENVAKLPPVVGIRLDKQSHIRDIVKTPDEVADLPVHEEVEFDHYEEYPSATETKSDLEEIRKDEVEKTDIEEKVIEQKEHKKTEDEGEEKIEKDKILDKVTDADTALVKEKTDVGIKEEKIEIEAEKEVVSKVEIPAETIEHKDKTVILEDSNKKELSKSPDEEKDKDEHELELKKEEIEARKEEAVIVKEEKQEEKEVGKEDKEVAKEDKEVINEEKETGKEIPKEEKVIIEKEQPVASAEKVEEVLKEESTVKTDLKSAEVKEIEKPLEKLSEKETKIESTIISDSKLSEVQEAEKFLETSFKEESIVATELKPTEAKKVEEKVGAVEAKPSEVKTEEDKFTKKDEHKDNLKEEQKDISDKRKESLIQEELKAEEVIEKSETEVKEKDDDKQKEDKEVKQPEQEKLKEPQQKLPDQKAIEEETKIASEDSKPTEEQKLKEDASTIHKIDEKLQKLKDELIKAVETEAQKIEEGATGVKEKTQLKEDVSSTKKPEEKLQKLEEEVEEKHIKAVSEVVTHKVEEAQHAEPVIITSDSLPDSPVTDEKKIEEKLDLGQKSPKEREEDVAKIVISVAEVLKSDAPLEEFEGKIPFNVPYKSYTTELRETHITTVESPITDESKTVKEPICPKASSTSLIEEEKKIAPIHEEPEVQESKISKMIKDSNELMQATSRMIQDIKQTQPKTDIIVEESVQEEQDAEAATVHRMLVTASSEDGGEETELCPPGTITFSRSSESSGRSSPDMQSQKLSQKSSITETVSDVTVIAKSLAKDLQTSLEDAAKSEESKQEFKDVKVSQPAIDEKTKDIDESGKQTSDKGEKLEGTKADAVSEKEASAKELNKDLEKKEGVTDVSEEEVPKVTESTKDVDEKKIDAAVSKDDLKEVSESIQKTEIKEEEPAPKKDESVSAESAKGDKLEKFLEDIEEQIEHKLEADLSKTKPKHKTLESEDDKQVETKEAKTEMKDEVVPIKDVITDLSKEVKSIIDDDGRDKDAPKKDDLQKTDELPKDSAAAEALTGKETETEKLEADQDKAAVITKLEETITKEAESVLETVEDSVKEAQKAAETKVEAVVKEVEEKKSFLGGLVNDIGTSLLSDTTKLIEDAQKQVQDIKDSAKSKIDELKEDIITKKEVLETAAEDIKDSFVKEISAAGEETTKQISDEVEKVKDTGKKEEEKLIEKTKEILESSKSKIEEVKETATKEKEKLLETKEEIAELTKFKLDEAKETLILEKEKLVETTKDTEKVVIKEADSVAEKIKSEVAEAKEIVEDKVKDVKETLAKQEETAIGVISDIKEAATKDVETKIDDVKKEVLEIKDEAKAKSEEVCELAAEKIDNKIHELETDFDDASDKTKEIIDERKKLLEETKEKIIEKASTEIKEIESKTGSILGDIKCKEESIIKDVSEEAKEVEDKILESKQEVAAKLDDLSKDLTKAKNTVESGITEKPLDNKDGEQPADVSEKKYDLYNGLETIEKMVVDVLTADREEVQVKSDAEKKSEDKKDLSGIVEKVEKDVEGIVDKGVAEVKEFVEETKEAITSLFKREPSKEEILEKTAHDIEENYEIVSDMAKSVVFEKCIDESHDQPEKLLEKAAESIEKDFETVTDMTKSVVFEKCDKSLTEEKREEKILQRSAESLEKDYEIVTDMAQSVVFEKCDKPLTEEKREEKVLERAAESLEKDYEIVTDLAKSIVFEKCDKPSTEEKREENVLERAAESLEKDYVIVTDMAKSMVFETCEEPLTEEQREEKVLEKSAQDIEENYKAVSDMAKSVVFDKCEISPKEEQKLEEKITEETKTLEPTQKEADTPLQDTKDTAKPSSSKDQEDEKESAAKSSGKSSPEKLETKDIYEGQGSKLPSDRKDLPRDESGKSTPDLKDVDHIKIDKVDNQDSLLSGKSSPGLSGKSSPLLSGRSSPGGKAESKDSLLSGKSTPDHTKPDSKESSLLSGKSSPGLSGELKPDEKEKVETAASGKSSPNLTTDVKDAVADKTGKISPELAAEKDEKEKTEHKEKHSGEITEKRDLTGHSDDKAMGKIASGRDSPESKLQKDVTESEKISGENKDTEKTDIKSGKLPLKPEKELSIKEELKASQEKEEQSAKGPDIPAEATSSIPEKKTETEKDTAKSEALPEKSLEVKIEDKKKLSISDVQVSLQEPGKEKPPEKYASDISKLDSPEDTKQDDKMDSIDSGIGTEVDAKIKKTEELEKTVASVEQITKEQASSLKPEEKSIAGPSAPTLDTSLSPAKTSTEDLHLSGKSTPDIAEVEKMKEMQEPSQQEKHIFGSSTPPTVPVSPIVKDISSTQFEEAKITPIKSSTVTSIKDSDIRSCTPGSDDYEIGASTHSDISSGQVSRAPHLLESERIESDEDDDVAGSPMSVTSQAAHSRSSSRYDFEDERIGTKMDPMNTSFYGALPDEEDTELNFEKAMAQHRQTRGEDLVATAEESPSYLYEVTKAKYSSRTPEPDTLSGETQLDQINKNGASNIMTASFMGDLPTTTSDTKKDAFESWGKPLGLPSPAPPNDNRGTPKKERKLPSNVSAKNKLNDDRKRSESPSKYKNKKLNPVYVDLTYVPHHGNSYYSYVDFFKRVRARYYVFSGIEPSREVYNALLEAKQTWEDKELEVTIIPTYDTDILGYWVAENEELLTKFKIDLSPSASRCTINLQDHETSCSAYRLEF